MNQDILVLLPTAQGKSSYCKRTGCIRRWNNTKPFARLPASSKTRLPKQEYLEWSVCPSWSWTLTVFVCTCMLLWKVVYNFPENSELPRSFFQRKLVVLRFLRMEIKNLQRSKQAHFLVSWLCCSIPHMRLTWACLQAMDRCIFDLFVLVWLKGLFCVSLPGNSSFVSDTFL